MLRENPERNAREILEILDEEIALAADLYTIMLRDSRIGYEDANQYYFNRTMVLEKIINCKFLKRVYGTVDTFDGSYARYESRSARH
jgi:hypothetical protein